MIINYLAKNLSKTVGIAILTVALSGLSIGPGLAALDKIDPQIEPSIQLLIDNNTDNDEEALNQLKQTPNVVDLLIKGLASKDIKVRQAVIKALGELGAEAKKAVKELITILENEKEDPTLRSLAAESLTKIAPTNPQIFHSLTELLSDQETKVYLASRTELENILRQIKSSELRQINIDKLKKLTTPDHSWKVRLGAAQALGASRRDIKTSVDTMIELLKDETPGVTQETIKSISYIWEFKLLQNTSELTPSENLEIRENLPKLSKFLADNSQELSKRAKNVIRGKNHVDNALKLISPTPITIIWKIINYFDDKNTPRIVVILLFYILLWGCLILPTWLWISPLSLIRFGNWLRITDLTALINFVNSLLKTSWPSISTLRLILLFGLDNHPKALDAWIKSKIKIAIKEFEEKETVKDRKIYVSVPVNLDDQPLTELKPENLQPIFAEETQCLLIYGEGGSGKTTLACQLAKWAMSDNPDQRLCKQHQMLPILVEYELDDQPPNDQQTFLAEIRKQLRVLTASKEAVNPEFLKILLKERRLLVIVDRFSEMTDDTRSKIIPDADFSVNALIVTSRKKEEESLGGINKNILIPLRVKPGQLEPFMTAYLRESKKRDLFNDQEIAQERNRLAELISQHDITVLLAKLYIEQMIAKKEGISNSLPNNVPELMLDYLNRINHKVEKDRIEDIVVHQDAKIIAWQCLKETYRPTNIRVNQILEYLEGDDAKERLKYLENHLRIIETIKPSQDKIRFTLDPLAEYLAALHLVELYSNDEQLWPSFLEDANSKPGSPEVITGFLLAIYDCCLAERNSGKIPEFLLNELAEMTKRNSLQSSSQID